MSKSLIVYFSQGGTTACVAEQIATGLRAERYQADLCNMKDEQPPDVRTYELLGIGLPVYYYRPPFNVTEYVNSLPKLDRLPAFVFLLHGTYRFDASKPISQALARRGARLVGYFHCRGEDFFLSYLKRGYLFSPDHPTESELVEAEAFGRQVADRLGEEQYFRQGDDQPAPIMYRLERLLTNRWLFSQIYSRMFKVDPENCTACRVCVRVCPTGNIKEDESGRPVWGRNCLGCLFCEMKCPEEVISSPSSGPLFRPFIAYNVRQASRDSSLDHVRVIHSRGRTRRLDG